MTSIGYALSSEEHAPSALVRYAQRAERAGFEFALISDHYHPWVMQQGQSGFVWSVLGAIANATSKLRVGTGVTCPIMRIHPAIIAQAAATTAELFGDRFFLGLGAGENLNEHVTGERWPRPAERHERLAEAIRIIRQLWSGEEISIQGEYFDVDEARVFSLPEHPPPIFVAATGADSAELAAQSGDGLIGTAPDADLIRGFREAGGTLACGQATVCWSRTEREALRTVTEWWPQAVIGDGLNWELKTVAHVEAACRHVTEAAVAEEVVCGPDPQRYLAELKKFVDAGYDHVYIHQVGPDQEGFFRFFEKEVRDRL